jgi:4,5:9,10-diseco-3-hydroxy-5,9,17-trioxoandrosta-1(10),2-diene-4-oate hydrolase
MLKAILAGSAVVLILAVVGGWMFFFRPMAVFNWLNRRALTNAGFHKVVVHSAVGDQTLFKAGEGQTIVFLHGVGDQAGAWSKVAPEILHTGRYRILLLDLAGHGDSGPRDGPLGIDVLLQGLDAVLSAEGGNHMILVGNSLGAWLALLYARQHPDRVDRVIPVNGGPITGVRTDVSLMPKDRAQASHLFSLLLDRGSITPPGFVLDDVIRRAHTGPISRVYAAAANMTPYILDGRLAELAMPVDILWGESDQLMPVEYARRMAAEMPNARLTLIPRCGHVPQQECATAFLTVLKSVLERSPQ